MIREEDKAKMPYKDSAAGRGVGWVRGRRNLELVTSAHTHLPHPDDSVSDENKKDDEGLDEGGDLFVTLLEPGQHLHVTMSPRHYVT